MILSDIATVRFQSTLPREERQGLLYFRLQLHIFQSTLPREERRNGGKSVAMPPLFQSTLPREERPTERVERGGTQISIHAPTRGATRLFFFFA